MSLSLQGITILGLGPGDPNLITRQGWEILKTAPEVYLRTRLHPVTSELPPALQVYSFDHLYEQIEDYKDVYETIVQEVLELGKRPQGVIYAVPGHPYVAEATCPEIVRRARELHIPARVIEGISFIEPTLTALELDPFPNLVFVDALELATAHVPPYPPNYPAIIAQIYARQVASDVKLTLMSIYPDEHPVRLVHSAGTAAVHVETLALYEIDHSDFTGLLTTLYVPPLGQDTSFEAFHEVIAHLRAPDGCPWDKEQTHQSLRPHLLEEAYELLAALDEGDPLAIQEELGDLLLQIVMHAQIASEEGEFTISDILHGVNQKIVQRHPHVFGDVKLDGIDRVLENWERLKEAERVLNGKGKASLLDGVAGALPALVQAGEYQKRVARVGFDWDDIQGVYDKIAEEVDEVRESVSIPEHTVAEIGDLLFTVVNLARRYGIDAESALREANARFRKRFMVIEEAARAQGRSIADLSLTEMEDLWQAAK